MLRTKLTAMAVACLWTVLLVGGMTARAQTTQPSAELAQGSSPIAVIARHGQSLRGKVDGFPILLLRGTQEERGEAHGFLAAKEIIGVCDATAAFLKQGSYAAGKPANPWEQGIEAVARFAFPLRFVAELRGMLRGIEMALPNEQDRQIPSLGRAITLEDLKLLQAGEVFELMRCSQFSAWGPLTGDGQPIVGRNWDYPPLYSMDYACVLAIEPAEKELSPTLDAVCFGMIGSGLATINRDGVYAAANDGGISEKGVTVDQPMPAGLLLRTMMEISPKDKVAEDFAQVLKNHCVLGLLFHMVVPGTGGKAGPSTIVEYHPRDGGQINLRYAEPKLPTALVMTNHCAASDNPDFQESIGRFQKISAALNAAGRERHKIDFDAARDVMRLVAKAAPHNTTLYTAVAWPAQRKMMVAVAPKVGVSATEGHYVMFAWDAIFATE